MTALNASSLVSVLQVSTISFHWASSGAACLLHSTAVPWSVATNHTFRWQSPTYHTSTSCVNEPTTTCAFGISPHSIARFTLFIAVILLLLALFASRAGFYVCGPHTGGVVGAAFLARNVCAGTGRGEVGGDGGHRH